MYPSKSKPKERPSGPGRERGGRGHFKRKSCRFCVNKEEIDYKNLIMLRNFITERGKILPRRITGTCARHQRAVVRAIKKNRTVALLPFTTV